MFRKRVEIYKKRDRENWELMKKVLKEAGIPSLRAGHYQQDNIIACGCGAKLDPRNFGSKGKIDRDIYWIRVPEEEVEKAKEVLRTNGLVPVVDQDLLLDASLRVKPRQDVF